MGRRASANKLERTQVADEVILGENIGVRAAEHLHSHIVVGDRVMPKSSRAQGFHEDARRVVDDEVVFCQQIITFLKQNAETTESSIVDKSIAAKLDLVRVHDGRARDV